jgi:D-arabinose 5-phosphate isomerase GutQ
MEEAIRQQVLDLVAVLEGSEVAFEIPQSTDPGWLPTALKTRAMVLAGSVERTFGEADPATLDHAVALLLRWMSESSVVRILGAGRARLAAAMPANRLAHGGARVFVKDDIIPMPHTVKGGGIIAASASGKTQTVLDDLRTVRRDAPHISVLGIASADAEEFASYCDCFIGIREVALEAATLTALADIGEHVISQVLDSLIVAAGRLGGFDDRAWRLGHENLGATGPYDARSTAIDLLFSERP